jgi:hypothetical protein
MDGGQTKEIMIREYWKFLICSFLFRKFLWNTGELVHQFTELLSKFFIQAISVEPVSIKKDYFF